MCPACGSPTSETATEFQDLCGPAVEILDVPVFVCDVCGACHMPREVIGRLAVILDHAQEQAADEGLAQICWVFTQSGPPGLGALSGPVRDCFDGLHDILVRERQLLEAAQQAVYEIPVSFH